MKILFVRIVILLITVQGNDICLEKDTQEFPEYQLVKKCHRSKLRAIARKNFARLPSCQQFAHYKRALSLNFSPMKTRTTKRHRFQYTCEVFHCAEVTGVSYSNDSRYDYYSLFSKPLPTINATCIPGMGMFYLITSKVNYTEAEVICRNKSSVLADITTEGRTEEMSRLLINLNTTYAYVALKRADGEFMSKSGGLDCTTYRAWAPGHPKKRGKADCVTISRDRTWFSMSCSDRLPALCEQLPGTKLH